jgi:hypothetical protein
MASNTIISSVVTSGSNNHTTIAEEINSYATDFVTQGVVGAITLNAGSGGTGSFCVNADASPDMGVTVKSGQAYITATPSSQDSQVLRARTTTDYTAYTINANASGSTKYDWIYLSVSAANANVPSATADNVTSIFTSRSSSNSTDNGTPPTYGLLLAVVTVANGASSITNANITDKRFNTSIGAQNGSLIVTQSGTGTDGIIQAAGTDANINLTLTTKGTGKVKLSGAGLTANTVFTPSLAFSNALDSTNGLLSQANAGTAGGTMYYINLGGVKMLWLETTSLVSSVATNTYTITLPTSFFSTLQLVSPALGILGTTAVQGVSISGKNTTTITILLQASITATAYVDLFVIGT